MNEHLAGVEPLDYEIFEVDAMGISPADGAGENTSSSYSSLASSNSSYQNASFVPSVTWNQVVSNLEASVEYFVRVSAQGDGVGYGEPTEAVSNPVVPRGVPGQLRDVMITRVDGSTLMVEVEQSAEPNGAEVNGYTVEWDTSSQFTSAQSMTVKPNYHIQAVRLNTWQRGWTSESEFSLSLFDFRGVYDERLGGEDSDGLPTFVSIIEGANTLTRITPNATAGFGQASLYKAVPRGGFIAVGGQEFRVCLNGEAAYDAEMLTLCSVLDPYAPEYFVGAATKYDNTLTRVPAYVLDTAIGSAFKLAVGDTALRTFDGPDTNISINDLTSTLTRGDHLRLGHPEEGRVFTVCKADGTPSLEFNSTYLPLCSGNDPEEVVSVMEGDIISATHEVQTFSVWLENASVVLNEMDTLGFRLVYGDETSSTSQTGGGAGCLSFNSSAAQVRLV